LKSGVAYSTAVVESTNAKCETDSAWRVVSVYAGAMEG